MDADEQRWYCYHDDEVYYARENRWVGTYLTAPIPRGRAPTREELIHYYLGANIAYSMLVAFLASTTTGIIYVPDPFASGFLLACMMFGCISAFVFWFRSNRSATRNHIDWLASPLWKMAFRPLDKKLAGLFLWWIALIVVLFLLLIVHALHWI